MILVDISLVMSKVERFFTCLRTVCVSFYADHLHPCPFFTGFFLFFFLLLTCRILFHFLTLRALGLPRWLSSKESTCQCRRRRRYGFDLLIRKIPWRRKLQPTPAFLPEKSHGWRGPVGCSPWGRKESDTTEHARMHSTT